MVFKEGSYHAIKEDGNNAEAYYLRGQAYLTLKISKKPSLTIE
jgi:hypothetical protein